MTTTHPIVLLAGGKLRSGKDTFADFLVKNHGFVKLGMSDTLADALYRLNPIIPGVSFPVRGAMRYQDHVDAVGYVQAKTHPEVRRLLQVLGTEVGRELLGKNIWVQAAGNRIKEQLAAGNSRVVLTGARFPNELEIASTEFNVFDPPYISSVYIDRPGLESNDSHASETSVSIDDFDYVVVNDRDLKTLEIRTSDLLSMVLKDHGE